MNLNLRNRIYRAKCYYLIFIFIDKLTMGKAFIQPEGQLTDSPVKFSDFCGKVGIKSQQLLGAPLPLLLTASHMADALVNPAVQVLDEHAFSFSSRKSHMLSAMPFCMVEINYLED